MMTLENRNEIVENGFLSGSTLTGSMATAAATTATTAQRVFSMH
jgi:hypothetical protein